MWPTAKEPSEDDETGNSGSGTFETDVSETGEDGTTVRQAEVRERDLSEVKKRK
jgi:hypothetical protein